MHVLSVHSLRGPQLFSCSRRDRLSQDLGSSSREEVLVNLLLLQNLPPAKQTLSNTDFLSCSPNGFPAASRDYPRNSKELEGTRNLLITIKRAVVLLQLQKWLVAAINSEQTAAIVEVLNLLDWPLSIVKKPRMSSSSPRH